jgi:hypothetical protein
MTTIMMDLNEIVTKPKEIVFQRKSEHVIENLKKRNINALYCRSAKDAIEQICRLIPRGASVTLGGSVTIMQSGLLEVLRGTDIKLLDRYRPGITNEEVEEVMLQA